MIPQELGEIYHLVDVIHTHWMPIDLLAQYVTLLRRSREQWHF